MIKLTQLETETLKALIGLLYAEAGFSDVDVEDIARDTGISSKSIRGALGSLVQKGIVHVEGTDTFGSKSYQLIYLNYDHWYLHPQWKDERKWSPEEMTVVLE